MRHTVAGAAMLASLVTTLVAAPSISHAQPVPLVTPRAGMVITQSVKVRPGVYRLRAPASLDSALLTIRGNNITVDLRGVTFVGSPADSAPDAGQGTAVRIDGGEQIRVRGLTARGYRVGVLARGTRALTLDSNDLSHSWKPRLFSVVEHESLNDWLSYHKNEHDEWLRFGAGIYVSRVTGGTLRGNTVRQSINGVLLTRTDSIDIRDNDLSYNSGLGIGMYRSSWNTIVNNRADYNVRGYSHGFFARGQDSAALLMFEQCTHNVVAYNSMTHSGDGLFLWAGQQTMDTGKGGSNDNVFLVNDFSFAPTNGMEATFSRNQFIGNRVEGNTHGLWGGYSYESSVIGNCFVNNRIGIAIEHGQQNTVGANRFIGDTLAIRLWADSVEPGDWGYPKHRDTRSRAWRFVDNRFTRVKEPWRIANTSDIDSTRSVVDDTASQSCDPTRLVPTTTWWRSPKIDHAPVRWPAAANAVRDRGAIVVDEWGPYDWQSPNLWPLDSTHAPSIRLRVMGPAGRWRLLSRRGLATLSATSGNTGDTIVVTPAAPQRNDWGVTLEYRGAATVSPRGVRTATGVPQRFRYELFEPRATWTQRVFAWSDSTDPVKQPAAFAALLAGPPLTTRTASRMDWFWSRSRDAQIPSRRMAMEATATLDLPPGLYTLRTLSDDAVRVWVDDQLVIDQWAPHETMPGYTPLTGGLHRVRAQYVQSEGWTEFRLDVLRGTVRPSPGSAGPH
ncbi:NosD domain-containing protein [Gemmatimonas sp.]|uniref:NosD domain-containing protein n=1 Tax=Gemmatimonas sp. TaxID=1962908 RepID=UPI00286A28E7|nr:NosD domain-containing protein [Gemmatimonas sp.]